MKKAVILSGGLGMRLRPFTNVIPKPLLPVGEKAVLEIQIERLAKCGFEEVILATNYKSDYLEKFFGDGSDYGAKLTISREDEPLGTAGPIKLLKDSLTEPFLVMNGDILTLLDFSAIYEYALSVNALFTVGIKKIVMPYDFGNIEFQGDYVTKVEEKPDIITYALAGVYVMKPAIMDLIPSNENFGIDRLLQSMLLKKMPVAKYEIEDYWLDIGTVESYEKAQEDSELFASETDL